MKYDLISVRSSRTPYKVSSPADIFKVLKRYSNAKAERFLVISLDGAHNVIRVRIVTVGLVNRCLVHPREVYIGAIKDNATAIVVSHNHPSGCNAASPEDMELTTRLRDAGALVGIPLLDHLIISKSGYLSFVEQGLLAPAQTD